MAEYYMFNKPLGCITARCDERHKTVMDYFPEEKRSTLFPVGRLDKDTEGFLIVTNDGSLCYNLMKPENIVKKTYFFHALCKEGRVFGKDEIRKLEKGVGIFKDRDALTAPAKVDIMGTGALRDIKALLVGKDTRVSNRRGDMPIVTGLITITEGKKHQVRRMIGYLGARVVYLKRVCIAGVELDASLPLGNYRPLTEDEIKALFSSFPHPHFRKE